MIAYWPVLGHDFLLEWDDPLYVTANARVQQGLSLKNIQWALISAEAANWHPLTWMSHMLDCQLYGLDPMGHHATNLAFHVANTLLLFWVFFRLTGAAWRSYAVAGLFALHPFHVESVAWVAERKDVLSTFFWLLTMLVYQRYTLRPNLGRYVLVLLTLGLGLMAKAMLVTLPVVLLLMDYWPLRRVAADRLASVRAWWPLFREKLPFFGLAAASSALTVLAQKMGGSIAAVEYSNLEEDFANAAVSVVSYLAKTIWPANLSPLYRYEHDLPAWQVVGALLLLVTVTLAVLRAARRHGSLFTGWFWYGITLLPVIGLVQVGRQAMADRYTYVPLIGIFIVAAWGVPVLSNRLWPGRDRAMGRVLAVALCGLLLTLAIATRSQVRYWRNSFTLFTRALQVDDDVDVAHFNLGLYIEKVDRSPANAAAHFKRALELNPRNVSARYSLALTLEERGRFEEAITEYVHALSINPGFQMARQRLALAQYNLGTRHAMVGALDRNLVQAYAWLSVAAANGVGAAMEDRDRIATEMSEAQLAHATELAGVYLGKYRIDGTDRSGTTGDR